MDRQTAGYLAEAFFEYQAILNGVVLSKPICNLNPYDYIADLEGRLVKCQVKKSYVDKSGRHVCSFQVCQKGGGRKFYIEGDFDFLCVVDLEGSAVYIIPWEIVKDIKSNIMVAGKVRGKKYSEYRNNWAFLALGSGKGNR